jgi:hypothetical protein
LSPSSLLLLHAVHAKVVGAAVHAVPSGEDALEVGEDVVGGECDELSALPIAVAEEVECVEWVGEANKEGEYEPAAVTDLLEEVNHSCASWEVGKAGVKEQSSDLARTPPP